MTEQFKKGIKSIGVACASFDRMRDKEVFVFGVIFRGALLVEGVLKTKIAIDGEDATEKISKMITNSSHWEQLKIIITRGVTIAGFNYIDLEQMHEITSLPIISIVDRKPNMERIANALKNLPNGKKRYAIIEKNGCPQELVSSQKEEPIYVQSIGLHQDEVKPIIRNLIAIGRIPEPIRVARLIAIAST